MTAMHTHFLEDIAEFGATRELLEKYNMHMLHMNSIVYAVEQKDVFLKTIEDVCEDL